MSDLLPPPTDKASLARVAARWWALRLNRPEAVARAFEAALYVGIVAELEERREAFARIGADHVRADIETDYEAGPLLVAALQDALDHDQKELDRARACAWDCEGLLPLKTRMRLWSPNAVGLFIGHVKEGYGAPLEDLWVSTQRRAPTWGGK